MDSDHILLQEAARIMGYKDASNLHRAARVGRLKTAEVGPLRTRVTTRAWLDEYRQGLRSGGYHRGQQRKGQDAGGQQGGVSKR